MNKFDKIIEYAKKDDDILAVAFFGSSVEGKGRDLDICLILYKKESNLKMSKKRLEYLKKFEGLDIQVFQQLPIYIQTRVFGKSKILLVKNEDLLYDAAIRTMKEFESYKKLYDMYLEAVKNG